MPNFPGGYTSFVSKIDEGAVVTDEAHTIPASAPYIVVATHPIKQDTPISSVSIPGFTEVQSGAPQPNQYDIDYTSGLRITFNASNAGQAILITYTSKGDRYLAAAVNESYSSLVRIESNMGLNAQGAYSTIRARLDALASVGLTNFKFNITPTGTINGINTIFIFPQSPLANSERIYVNGLRQARGVDYSMAGAKLNFVAGSTPVTGDILFGDYNHL